jgi:hypothetical protein
VESTGDFDIFSDFPLEGYISSLTGLIYDRENKQDKKFKREHYCPSPSLAGN